MKNLVTTLVAFFIFIQAFNATAKSDHVLLFTINDGNVFNLSEKQGRVVLINFWASWCVNCLEEMPILEEVYQKYKAKNLEIVGISIDRAREKANFEKYSSVVSYPNVMLNKVKKTNFEEPYAVPLTYIIDKNGEVVKTISPSQSALTVEDFDSIIKPLL